MHWNEHSPFLSTNSASSLIGSGNGSAPQLNATQSKYGLSLFFHNQDTASPPFPQRKELVAQVTRICWPHLISATMVQPGSLFLSLHFITAFVIMQAPRHPFLEARAISQSSIWLCDLSYGFWTLSLVLSLSIGSTGAWVYILLASSRAIGQRYSLRQIQKVSRYCLFVQPSEFAVDEKITQTMLHYQG